MQGPKQFKQALLDSLLVGLQKRRVASTRDIMGFHEKKRAIRLAADAALMKARGADATRWSRTLPAAPELAHLTQITLCSKSALASASSNVVLRRRYRPRRPRKAGMVKAPYSSAEVMARAMVRERTKVLKGIVPGGEGLDDQCTLMGEALDYAVCLKAQVDVMQHLVRALQAAKP